VRCRLTITLALLALASPSLAQAQLLDVRFLHKLSSTTGVLPLHGLAVDIDPVTKEVLVVGEGRVRIFNRSGMEVFSFGDDPELGGIASAAPTADGDYLLLSMVDGSPVVVRANFRGEFKERIVPRGLPAEVSGTFGASVVRWALDRIYLADLGGMRVVVLRMDGSFEAFHDLAKLCGVEDKRADNGVKGFRVAPNGDILFTVQTLFKAYVLSPDGTLRPFGQRGSAPGKFNVVTGIAVDEQGRYYVADILKSAVLVFDKDFRWLKEFGYRGGKPGNLFAPVDVAAGDGKVFVSQYAKKGVSVFEVKVPEIP
jgi:hypothetical protein